MLPSILTVDKALTDEMLDQLNLKMEELILGAFHMTIGKQQSLNPGDGSDRATRSRTAGWGDGHGNSRWLVHEFFPDALS